MTHFTRSVSTPQEYRDTCKHAEALGFQPALHYAKGDWEASDGDAVFLDEVDLQKVGNKYFHITLTTDEGEEVVSCLPCSGGRTVTGPGRLNVTFSGPYIATR